MGLLIDGHWHNEWYDTKKSGGRFIRSYSQFRNWITKDGSPGPTGVGGMAENGWTFEEGPGVIADPIINADYTHVEPKYSGRVTVPVLYDKKTDSIVNNES